MTKVSALIIYLFIFLYFNEFFVLKCFTFFLLLTYEHGTRKEKIQKNAALL